VERAEKCTERVKVQGGWVYEVHRARTEHQCSYCGGVIRSGEHYVAEYAPFTGLTRRYHPLCFNKVFEGTSLRVRAVYAPSGVKLCYYE
jgi:hypothetical protein